MLYNRELENATPGARLLGHRPPSRSSDLAHLTAAAAAAANGEETHPVGSTHAPQQHAHLIRPIPSLSLLLLLLHTALLLLLPAAADPQLLARLEEARTITVGC